MALIELQRFVEFGDDWYNHKPRRRADLKFEPMLVETSYVGWVKRYEIWSGEGQTPFQLCEVHMTDRGGTFTFDMTYQSMRDLLRECEKKR